jgi:hypothetical protein
MNALQKTVEREVFGIRDDKFAIEQKKCRSESASASATTSGK